MKHCRAERILPNCDVWISELITKRENRHFSVKREPTQSTLHIRHLCLQKCQILFPLRLCNIDYGRLGSVEGNVVSQPLIFLLVNLHFACYNDGGPTCVCKIAIDLKKKKK